MKRRMKINNEERIKILVLEIVPCARAPSLLAVCRLWLCHGCVVVEHHALTDVQLLMM